MQIVRFRADGKTRYGALEGSAIIEYSGTPFTLFKRARKRYAARQVVLRAPVLPSKIIAVALNYRDHLAALGVPVPEEPVLFLKAVSALAGPDDPIVARQRSSTKDMVFSVEEIVARVATVMTLLAGDVIATGTPAGAGRMESGDRIEVRIDGIGSLRNTVVKL